MSFLYFNVHFSLQEFSCSFCSYKTKYENEIIYHSKKKCQENSDDEQRTEEVSVDVERRVSTRKKKRKFQYDSANELNETSEDEKTHTDHDFGAELASDDEEYFSDIEDRRSRSKKSTSKWILFWRLFCKICNLVFIYFLFFQKKLAFDHLVKFLID